MDPCRSPSHGAHGPRPNERHGRSTGYRDDMQPVDGRDRSGYHESIHPRGTALFWLLDAQYEVLRNLSGGEQRDGLNLELLGDLSTLLPPLDEQRAIAAYLDRETERIDALVAKKRLLIERLEEYRTALITRTVTRGLPPEAGTRRRPRPLATPQALGRRVARRRAGALGGRPELIRRYAEMKSGHTPSRQHLRSTGRTATFPGSPCRTSGSFARGGRCTWARPESR